MCGITGLINLNAEPAAAKLVERMTNALAHRGPDGEGVWQQGPVALGHRRLAIIDLSPAGHQPMATNDGRFVISHNGEVYNFRELRTELEAKGYHFHSRTDSEVILNAFACWGLDALTRFNGMFAFAVWDNQEQQLTLARDRYGIKPLYYTLNNNTLLFASEAKALLQHPNVKAEMDLAGLLEYFTFQNFFTDKTLFNNIHLLPAGCCMQIAVGTPAKPPKILRYWDYQFEEPSAPLADEVYLERLDQLFTQAVSRQLVSDVDVCAYLSGGLDSGSIAAVAAKQLPYMKTFTCGFDLSSASGVELSFDERSAAERMSYQFKTEHYEMVLKAGDMERVMPRLTHHLEEPRVGQSYPNFYIAQLASKFGKVALAGTGGDEIFGGYPWRYYRVLVNNNFENYIDKYYQYWNRLIPNRDIENCFQPIWSEVKDISTRDIFRDVFTKHADRLTQPEDYINHSLYLEAKTFLHGLLTVEDKLSMAHGLETRVPFLDNDLVDFAMKLPTRLKLDKMQEVLKVNENDPGEKTAKYFQKTRDGKLLLRRMMQRHVPQEVVDREKQGFSAPDASWFQGESIDYVRRLLYDNKAKIYDYLDRQAVQTLVDEHLSGKQNRRLLIWSLLSVENWCQAFLD